MCVQEASLGLVPKRLSEVEAMLSKLALLVSRPSKPCMTEIDLHFHARITDNIYGNVQHKVEAVLDLQRVASLRHAAAKVLSAVQLKMRTGFAGGFGKGG